MTKPPQALAELEDLLDPGAEWTCAPTLLRVLTHLYLQRPNSHPEDEHYYTELALRLIDAADLSGTGGSRAARLAPYPSAPSAVIARLARDVIEVAAPDPQAFALPHRRRPRGASPTQHGAATMRRSSRRGLCPARAHGAGPPLPPIAAQALACELSELFYAADAPERRLILLNLDYALAHSVARGSSASTTW